ncbi:MAG: hypothetical protein ABJJ03_05485 [Sulfitobacter sp.]
MFGVAAKCGALPSAHAPIPQPSRIQSTTGFGKDIGTRLQKRQKHYGLVPKRRQYLNHFIHQTGQQFTVSGKYIPKGVGQTNGNHHISRETKNLK